MIKQPIDPPNRPKPPAAPPPPPSKDITPIDDAVEKVEWELFKRRRQELWIEVVLAAIEGGDARERIDSACETADEIIFEFTTRFDPEKDC